MHDRRAFVDTNVIVYSIAETPFKTAIAKEILVRAPLISVQVLNETVNVARSKLRRSWDDIAAILGSIRRISDVLPLDLATHQTAVFLARRHNFHIYDALIVASALEAGCDTLYSEDMHHGLVVEDRVRIINPFLA